MTAQTQGGERKCEVDEEHNEVQDKEQDVDVLHVARYPARLWHNSRLSDDYVQASLQNFHFFHTDNVSGAVNTS